MDFPQRNMRWQLTSGRLTQDLPRPPASSDPSSACLRWLPPHVSLQKIHYFPPDSTIIYHSFNGRLKTVSDKHLRQQSRHRALTWHGWKGLGESHRWRLLWNGGVLGPLGANSRATLATQITKFLNVIINSV